MSPPDLPLVLMAGRDHGKAPQPEERSDLHILQGYKALEIEIAGRPMLAHVLERIRESGGFHPIYVAGPRQAYEGFDDGVRLIDTDGDFGENIQNALEAVAADGYPGQVAVMTSDVLPEVDELRAALDDLGRHQPCDYWMVECRADDPSKLGTSAWKRKYYIRSKDDGRTVPTLPGHLFVADPRIVRLDLLYRLFEVAYRTRNRPTAYRRTVVVRTILATLLFKDLKRLLTFRIPRITYEMLWNGLVAIKKAISTDGIDHTELEDRLRQIWIRIGHRRRHRDRRGRLMIHDGVSLARDVDTEEEAREFSRLLDENQDPQRPISR